MFYITGMFIFLEKYFRIFRIYVRIFSLVSVREKNLQKTKRSGSSFDKHRDKFETGPISTLTFLSSLLFCNSDAINSIRADRTKYKEIVVNET